MRMFTKVSPILGAKTILLAAASLSLVSTAASAATYDLDYTVTGVGPVDLVITTDNTTTTGSYGDTGYRITQVTGTRNGVAVTGVGNQYSADNIAILSSPHFDYAGFTYSTAAQQYGLYWANVSRSTAQPGSYAECYGAGCDGNLFNANAVTNLTRLMHRRVPKILAGVA